MEREKERGREGGREGGGEREGGEREGRGRVVNEWVCDGRYENKSTGSKNGEIVS